MLTAFQMSIYDETNLDRLVQLASSYLYEKYIFLNSYFKHFIVIDTLLRIVRFKKMLRKKKKITKDLLLLLSILFGYISVCCARTAECAD